jgi:cobalt/nickel transport system ATP-binding protein
MLVVGHDLDLILDVCGRAILLDRGQVAADGPAARMLCDGALLESHGLELPLSVAGRA